MGVSEGFQGLSSDGSCSGTPDRAGLRSEVVCDLPPGATANSDQERSPGIRVWPLQGLHPGDGMAGSVGQPPSGGDSCPSRPGNGYKFVGWLRDQEVRDELRLDLDELTKHLNLNLSFAIVVQ